MSDRSYGPDGVEADEIPGEEELLAGLTGIRLTPTEHQRVKDLVHGDLLNRIEGYDRRYLVAGAGSERRAADRRRFVYESLDGRTDPDAVATQLEDFGLSPDEIRIWTRVFDLLCGLATHIVAVIEDFDGGYVWELGLLFAPSYREKAWVLKRRYPDEQTERERYDDGMSASHVKLLLTESLAEASPFHGGVRAVGTPRSTSITTDTDERPSLITFTVLGFNSIQ